MRNMHSFVKTTFCLIYKRDLLFALEPNGPTTITFISRKLYFTQLGPPALAIIKE
jgi:hypothetical protein